MKIADFIRTLAIVFILSNSLFAQKEKEFLYCVSGSVVQEFDLLSSNYPIGGNLTFIAGRILLMGEYKHAGSRITPVQTLVATDNYQGKIGFGGRGSSDKGYSNVFATVGIQQLEFYKKLMMEEKDYPRNVNNMAVEAEKVNVLTTTTQYSVGFQIVQQKVKQKYDENDIIDDFDLRIRRKHARYSTLSYSLDILYAKTLNYSKSFEYSAYGYYIPQDATLNIPIKEKHFGVKIRMEATTYSRIGIMVEMGVLPGITYKSDLYNDFNFCVRGGIIANMSLFKRPL